MHPIYRLQNVTKQYNGRCVLDIPALEIFRGEVFALVGPSGAGKSTLLRLLNFLETPTRGAIYFEDMPFSANQDMPLPSRRRVTTVFQRPVLLERTVFDNVAYGLLLRGEREARQPVMEALDVVGLAHLARQLARTLSGGEAQRVALARALVIKPHALLLDEPTANLDPCNISLIEEIVKNLNRTQGVTVVLVTHNVFQARRIAHRTSLLLEGKIIETAPTDQFFSAPTDPRSSAFIRGDMIY